MTDTPAAFTGEIHPLADIWPLLAEEELQALAESISTNGLRERLVLDQHGRLIDGRNRLAACHLAGVEPTFVHVTFLDGVDDVAAYIGDRNAERRHLTAGQQAMGRALMLQAQGKRKNGRWERHAITQSFGLWQDESKGETEALRKAGLILDIAIRAAALGDDYTDYIDLPAQVMSLGMTLDYAYRMAEAFEGKAALAEMMRREPFAKAVAQADAIVDELAKQLPPPAIDVPLTKADRAQLNNLAKRLRDLAAKTAAYAKESK